MVPDELISSVAGRAAHQNCLFLLQQHTASDNLYNASRCNNILVESIRAFCKTYAPTLSLHGMVTVQSQREITMISRLLKESFPNMEVCELDGHSEIVDLRDKFNQIWRDDTPQILVTSSNCFLHIFCLGLTRMEKLDFIFFDNLTGANNNHPYCVIMESFYSPLLAKYFMNTRDEFSNPKITRIMGIADWPRILPGENFQVKMTRVTKLTQYHRLFHSTIIPVKAEISGAITWMPESDLDEASEKTTLFGDSRVLIVDEDIPSNIENIIQNYTDQLKDSNLLVIMEDPSLISYIQNIQIMSDSDARSISNAMRNISIVTDPRQQSLLYCIINYIPLKMIIVADPESDPALSLMLMAASAKKIPITFLRLNSRESLQRQAADMVSCIASLTMSINVSASELTRKLKSFLGNFETLARAAPFAADESVFHLRVPCTGAMLIPSFNVSLLMAICSYLPKSGNDPKHHRNLRLSTCPVKRVSSTGTVLDCDRHYFMSKVTLPHCLFELSYIPLDELEVSGPITPSRFSSLTSACFEALKKLVCYKVIDENLIPIPSLLNTANFTLMEDYKEQKRDEELLDEAMAPDDVSINEIKEIIPTDLQFDDSWKSVRNALLHPVEEVERYTFFMHIFEYQTQVKDAVLGDHSKDIKLPADSFIHLTDVDFFNSSTHSLAILMPKPLQNGLKDIVIPLGPHLNIRGRLKLASEPVILTKAEMEKLLEFQVFLYGAINVRPIVVDSLPEQQDINEQDDFMLGGIPDDKKTAYLTAFVCKGSSYSNVFDMDDTLKRFKEFVTMSKDTSFLNAIETHDTEWKLDWNLMEAAINQENYKSLDIVMDDLEVLQRKEEIPDGVEFESWSPGKPPLNINFKLFAMRRLIVYAPHNGIFYRLKKWHQDQCPSSPFESKSFPECKSYADYMAMRYGLQVKELSKMGLAETKRIENFVDMSLWVSRNDKPKQTSSRRKGDFKSMVIPELVKVSPLPYGFLRLAMLLPRIIFEVERQLLIVQYFRDQFPTISQYWPTVPVMVEALTGPTAAVDYDYERMEILGDSVLKLFTTIDVFLSNNVDGEGKLSSQRQERICNFNLYMLSIKLDLTQYARLTPFIGKLFAPPDIESLLEGVDSGKWPYVSQLIDDGKYKWLQVQALDDRADRRFALYHLYPDGTLKDAGQKAQDPTQYKYKKRAAGLPVVTRFGYSIPPKSLADLMESSICAFYFGPGGLDGAREFMMQVGLLSERMSNYRRNDSDVERIFTADENFTSDKIQRRQELIAPSGSEISTNVPPYAPSEGEFPYEGLEAILKYKFKNRRLLFLACTHVSVDLTHSYERLEWIGDAALDWVVMKYYFDNFDDPKWMTPARITLARQTTVCNEAFARVTIHHGLQKYLRVSAPLLQLDIENFATAYLEDEERRLSALNSGTHLPHRDTQAPTVPPAPKTLGDILESLAGAVFIDINFDLEAFTAIFLPLLQFFLDTHGDPYDLPDNPTHDFWHDIRVAGLSGSVEFQYEPKDPQPGDETKCRIMIQGRTVVEGLGPNRAFARTHATRLAIEYIRSRGWREFCPI